MATDLKSTADLFIQSVPTEHRAALLQNIVVGLQQTAVGNQAILDEGAKDAEFWDTGYLIPTLNRQAIVFYRDDAFAATTPQAGVLKTLEEFNLPTVGKFTAPQCFTISYIRFSVMSEVDGTYPLMTDLEQLRTFGAVTYIAGQKDHWTKPLEQFSDSNIWGHANAAADGGAFNFGPIGQMDFEMLDPPEPQVNGLGFGFRVSVAPQFTIQNAMRCRFVVGGRWTVARD